MQSGAQEHRDGDVAPGRAARLHYEVLRSDAVDMLPDGAVVEESDGYAGLALRPPRGAGRRALSTAAAAAVALTGAAAAAGWAWRASAAGPRGAAHGAPARRVELQQVPWDAAAGLVGGSPPTPQATEAPFVPGQGYAGYEEDLERYNSLFNDDPEREAAEGTYEAAPDSTAGYAFANPAPTPEFPEILLTPSPTLRWWYGAGNGTGAGSSGVSRLSGGASSVEPAAALAHAVAPGASVLYNGSEYARYPAAAAGTTLPALATSSIPAYAAVAQAFPTSTATAIPTTTTETSSTTTMLRSLFCFALMMPSGDEVSLMRELLRKSQGIFLCDSYSVFSSEDVELSAGPPARIGTEIIGSVKCEYGGEYNLALNSEIFVRVWKKVFSDKLYAQHGWTVKVDPDAVFFPDRLLWQVRDSNSSDSVYLNNCDQGLHGPIEVISLGGMRVFDVGIDKCVDELQHEFSWAGEDVFLRHCLGVLNVNRVDNWAILDEEVCFYGDPVGKGCYSGKVAFHPFKHPDSYFHCVDQALESSEKGGRATTTTSRP